MVLLYLPVLMCSWFSVCVQMCAQVNFGHAKICHQITNQLTQLKFKFPLWGILTPTQFLLYALFCYLQSIQQVTVATYFNMHTNSLIQPHVFFMRCHQDYSMSIHSSCLDFSMRAYSDYLLPFHASNMK